LLQLLRFLFWRHFFGTHCRTVETAMHCNLKLPDAAPVLIRLNHDAYAKFEVAQLIRCSHLAILLLIGYVTL